MEEPLEAVWVVPQVGRSEVSGYLQHTVKGVNQVVGDSVRYVAFLLLQARRHAEIIDSASTIILEKAASPALSLKPDS